MWKWAITAGIIGYLFLHPAVMVSGHLMMEGSSALSLKTVVAQEIKRSFSMEMLPWSSVFTFFAAALGGLYGHLKGLEQVLRASRVRYQTVVDDQLDYIFRFQPDGRCTFINDALCRLIHCSRKSILNKSLFEQPEFGNFLEWRSKVEQLSPENPKKEIEQRLKMPEGTTCWVRWIVIAIMDDAGRIKEYQSVGRDITEIKRAQKFLESNQEELERLVKQRTRALNEAVENLQQEIQERIALEKDIRENELKYRLLFESVPIGVVLTTYEGRMLKANPAFLEMIRLTPNELEEIDVQSIYARKEDRRLLLNQLRQNHRVEDAEVELKRRDGDTFYAGINLIRSRVDGQDRILSVVKDISRRKHAMEALQRSEADLQDLSARLMSVQEQERKRIARELHDSVGQLMHAMKYGLETALKQLDSDEETANVRATLERLPPIVREAAAENRRIVMALRPSMLDDLGLLATVNWFCREFSGIYKSIAIDKTIAVGEDDIPMALRVILFRIIQEAFNNVAKHSRATRVRLTIATEGGDLVVEIEDNGIGLQQESKRTGRRVGRGFGLSGIRERARASGGRLHLTAASGAGTRMRVVWPGQSGPKIKAVLDWQI